MDEIKKQAIIAVTVFLMVIASAAWWAKFDAKKEKERDLRRFDQIGKILMGVENEQ